MVIINFKPSYRKKKKKKTRWGIVKKYWLHKTEKKANSRFAFNCAK